MEPSAFLRWTAAVPPSDQEFEEISRVLVNSFGTKLGRPVEVLSRFIEPKCWVTTTILVGDRPLGRGTVYHGVLSYSFRTVTGTPFIDAVLLVFRDGLRSFKDGRSNAQGYGSILTSDFSESGWSDPTWADDGYGEWECDRLDEITTIPVSWL